VLTVAGTVLGVALGVYLLSRTLLTVGLVVACALIAVALDHAVKALERRGWKRGLAIAAVVLLLFGLMFGIGWLVVPEAVRQVEQLAERLPALLNELKQNQLYRMLDERFDLDRFFGGGATLPEGAVATSIQALRSVVLWTVLVVTGLFVVIFMLVFGGHLVEALLAEAVPAHRERYERLLRNIYGAVGGYIGGLAILSAVNATVNTIALALFGLPFFLPLGLLSGVGSFLPYVGAVLTGTLMGVIGVATGGIWLGVGVVAWYAVYQQLENHLLAPLVYRRTVNLNPLVALLAVIFIAEIVGVLGAILAVPVAAVGQTILKEILRFRRERLEVPPGVPVAEALEARQGEDDGPPPPHDREPPHQRH
jgi:predicted PurR-regulated permease PerM